MAVSLRELRPPVLAHVWGPPPVQFPGNRLVIPEESGGNGAGGGALPPGPVYEERGQSWLGVRESTQPPGLYSDQVVRWVEPGTRAQAAPPSGSSTRSSCRFRVRHPRLWLRWCPERRRAPHRPLSQPLPQACFENSGGLDLRAPRPVLSLLICLTLAANCRFFVAFGERTPRLMAASCGGGGAASVSLVALRPWSVVRCLGSPVLFWGWCSSHRTC